MKSTRDQILQTLLTYPRSTINELAQAVGINSISVRHHLTSLQADGLVTTEEERHGVGRPRMVYILTESGVERFPTHYLRFTNRLIDLIKSKLPEETTTMLFSQMGLNLAASYSQHAKSLPVEQRLEIVKEALTKEGFIVDWEKKDDQYLIHEISCPYYHIGQSHPEVCIMDQTLIANILAIPVERVRCLLDGNTQCTFVLSALDAVEKPA
jgi:DeoR family suf operon transcriptional repressor